MCMGHKCVGAVLLAGTICCGSDEPVWWEGEYVRYAMSSDLTACAGTVALVDSFVPFVAGELGVKLPPKIEYQWLNRDEYGETVCPEGTRGCARGHHAYAQDPVLLHELVHGVTSASGMNGLPFFSEGLAVAYDPFSQGGPRYIPSFAAPFPDPRLEMTRASADLDYGTASWFVTFLLVRHGPKPFVAISQRTHYGQDLDAIRAEFRAVYGRELDDEADLYMKGSDPGCGQDYFALRPHDCTGPTVPWSSGRWGYEQVLDCGFEDVAGGVGDDYDGFIAQSVTLDVPAAGGFTIEIYGGENTSMQLGRCFGCPWQHNDVTLYTSTDPVTLTTLEAGPYFVRLSAAAEDAPLARVVIKPVG